MGEYARINEGWTFWRKYAKYIIAVDESLIMPVLLSLNARVEPKWEWDVNSYRCRVRQTHFEFVFDMQDDASEVVTLTISQMRTDGNRVEVCTISIPALHDDWANLQDQFKSTLLGIDRLQPAHRPS